MKRIKIMGCALLALFALSATMAAVASAEEGFLPETIREFTLEGGVSTLNTKANLPVVCSLLDPIKGTLVNDKHATIVLHWLKCTIGGIPVNSENDKGQSEVILVEVLLLVCLKPENSEGKVLGEFGIAAEVLKAPITLEVPSLGVKVKVKGLVIGAVTAGAGVKKLEFPTAFSGELGKQVAVKCHEGTATKEHSLLAESSLTKTDEVASENVAGGKVVFPKEVELMDS